MRRALAGAILGISFWIGSLAWTGFVLLRTVLDPGRSAEVAEALYDDEVVREKLAENVADAIDAALPADAPVPRPAIEDAAAQALESPAVEAVFVDALVQTHAAFLGEGEAPEAVEAGAFGAAARQSIVEGRPGLDGVLPDSPELRVPLPTERVPNLGPVRDVIEDAVPVLAATAAVGALLALLVTSNRPAVVRRAGFWAIGLSVAVLAFAYGLPALADRFTPDQSEIVAALVGAMAAATRGPALVLAGVGVGAVALSLVWRAAPALADATTPSATDRSGTRRAPTAPGPVPAATPWTRRRDLPRPARRAGTAAPDVTAGPEVTAAPDVTAAMPTGLRPRSAAHGNASPPPTPGPRPGSPRTPPVPGPGTAAPARRWVEGVGWVLDTSESIPTDARWVPGVGYVVDDR